MDKICQQCGKDFTPKNLRNKNIFCSTKCSGVSMRGKRPKNYEMASKKAHEARKGKPSWNKGKRMSKELCEKMSKARKGKIHAGSFKKGHTINLGRKMTKKTVKRMRVSARKGKDSNFWKGGKCKIYELIRACSKYREWRLKVFGRDRFTCQGCKKVGGKLNAHHIKALSIILKENEIRVFDDAIKCGEIWEIDNGITLCVECHKLTDSFPKNIF